ncbi:MAG: hypothetical protein ACE5H0_00075 [Bacteroidota bacterium]
MQSIESHQLVVPFNDVLSKLMEEVGWGSHGTFLAISSSYGPGFDHEFQKKVDPASVAVDLRFLRDLGLSEKRRTGES